METFREKCCVSILYRYLLYVRVHSVFPEEKRNFETYVYHLGKWEWEPLLITLSIH